jgi:hypothetical protein
MRVRRVLAVCLLAAATLTTAAGTATADIDADNFSGTSIGGQPLQCGDQGAIVGFTPSITAPDLVSTCGGGSTHVGF